MTKPKTGISSVVLPGRFGPLAEAHLSGAGGFALPPKIVGIATRAAELAAAAKALNGETADLERTVKELRDGIVADLVKSGAKATPGAELRVAIAAHQAAKDDAGWTTQAARRAADTVVNVTIGHAESIHERLVAALETILAAAEPDVPAIAALASFSDPAAVAALDGPGQDAWHRLDRLGAEYRRIVAAAFGFITEINVNSTDSNRAAARALFDPLPFMRAGSGVSGPLLDFRGTDRYALVWQHQPAGHVVQSLVAAVLDHVDDADDVAEAVTA